jgi:hypothetical protein
VNLKLSKFEKREIFKTKKKSKIKQEPGIFVFSLSIFTQKDEDRLEAIFSKIFSKISKKA